MTRVRLFGRRRAGRTVLALAIGLLTATGPGVTASAALPPGTRPDAPPTALAGLRQLLARAPGVTAGTGCSSGGVSVTSTNSAGYADCGGCPQYCYTGVSGSSQISKAIVRCEGCYEFAASWVGLDGYSDDNAELVGVLAEEDGSSVSYDTWWETSPGDMQITGTTARPGDQINASVVHTGSSYTLTLTDATTSGNNISVTRTCTSCAGSSAEWITSTEPSSIGTYPLADFGTWTVNSAYAVGPSGAGGISASPYARITMVDSRNTVMVSPSALSNSGTNFTNTWLASS